MNVLLTVVIAYFVINLVGGIYEFLRYGRGIPAMVKQAQDLRRKSSGRRANGSTIHVVACIAMMLVMYCFIWGPVRVLSKY